MNKEYSINLSSLTSKKASLKPGEILTFDRFIRLNPHWVVIGTEIDETNFQLSLRDHETEKEFDLSGSYYTSPSEQYKVVFSDYDILSIIIKPKGEEMVAEVEYNTDEPDEKLETQVILWLRSIREYLRLYLKSNPYNYFFRILMNKMVLTMTPSQRKICLMLYRVTLLEILAIVLIVVGYFLFVPQ